MTLWADDLRKSRKLLSLTAAWYAKERVTFSDTLASVRRALVEVPRRLLDRLTVLACYAV